MGSWFRGSVGSPLMVMRLSFNFDSGEKSFDSGEKPMAMENSDTVMDIYFESVSFTTLR